AISIAARVVISSRTITRGLVKVKYARTASRVETGSARPDGSSAPSGTAAPTSTRGRAGPGIACRHTTTDPTADAPATCSVWMIQRGAATGAPAAEAETGTPEAIPFWIDWSTRAGPTTTATAPIVICASTNTTRLYATRTMAGGRPGVF